MTVTVSTTPFVLAAGETLATIDEIAIRLQTSATDAPAITVAGTVSVSGTGAARSYLAGVYVGDSGFYATTLRIETSGSVLVDASAGRYPVYGVGGSSWMPTITNAGLISATARSDVFGVQSGGRSGQVAGTAAVLNTGTISATATAGNATGVYMPTGDAFANGGLVEAVATGLAYGVHMYQWGSSFLNTGVIRAVDSDPARDSVAVYLNTTVTQFLNAGLLEGDYALKFLDHNSSGGWTIPAPTTFENSGRMVGKVDLGHLRQVLLNTGSIEGDVNLGNGDDTYSGRDGSVAGMVSGGDGADRLIGGSGFEYLQGNAGNDTASGNGGDDWVVGGKDNDLLFGDDGADIVYGNLGDDTGSGGSGNDLVRGGQGNDSLEGDAGADWLSGDRGDDTVSGGAGADIFHGSQDAGLDRVTDFSAAQGDRVQLDAGTTYSVSQVGADTVIDMGAGHQMVLVNVQLSTLPAGWIFGA